MGILGHQVGVLGHQVDVLGASGGCVRSIRWVY